MFAKFLDSENIVFFSAGVETVDECGLRYLMAMKQHEYLLLCLPYKQKIELRVGVWWILCETISRPTYISKVKNILIFILLLLRKKKKTTLGSFNLSTWICRKTVSPRRISSGRSTRRRKRSCWTRFPGCKRPTRLGMSWDHWELPGGSRTRLVSGYALKRWGKTRKCDSRYILI